MSEAVVGGRRLSRDQRLRLGEAERLAAGGWRDRQRAAAMVRQVELELAEAREAAATEAAIANALSRARRRGEELEVETVEVGEWRRNDDGTMARRHGQLVLDVQKVRRASRVDGLASLYKAGVIDDATKQAGDRFRQLWERARPPMTTGAYGAGVGGDRNPGRMLDLVRTAGCAGAVVVEIGQRLADERGLRVLILVAGQGLTIRSLGDGGDLKAANRERLIAALRVVEEVLSEPKWSGLAKQAR